MRNVEAMGRDETVRGRERVRESSGQNLGKYPLFGVRREPIVIGDRSSN